MTAFHLPIISSTYLRYRQRAKKSPDKIECNRSSKRLENIQMRFSIEDGSLTAGRCTRSMQAKGFLRRTLFAIAFSLVFSSLFFHPP